MKANVPPLLLLAHVLLFVPIGGHAGEISGVYGKIERDQKSGDFTGTTFHIMRSNAGFFVAYRCASGEIAPPVLLKAVVEKQKISFVVPDSFKFFCHFGKFEGTFSDSALIGRFTDGSKKELVLKKYFTTE